MLVVSIVGARPQFVKLAPVAEALATFDVAHDIVHTGQHYDASMSDVFFQDLAIPAASVHLGVGSGSHGVQTGAILAALDPVLDERRPDWVLVYGDTNSTLAGALAAVKANLPVAHMEAGLRSFNRRMPEEHNRVLTDHAADLCLAPTEVAMGHLRREGLERRAVLVGDVMTDICLAVRDRVTSAPPHVEVASAGTRFVLATLHRAENTDDPVRLSGLLSALARLDRPVLMPVHPRLRARCEQFGLRLHDGALVPVSPLTYPEVVFAVQRAEGVVTDSGGLQKESYLLGTPCTTLRTETEWPETLTNGWNVLDPDGDQLTRLAARERPAGPRGAPYGCGRAAQRVVETLLSWG